jgi:Uma2 family endonuclease
MSILQKRLTLEEFLALPERKPALELEPDGTVRQKVSPKGRHSTLQVAVVRMFDRFGPPRKLAMAFTELRVTFGGASRVPDVAVYRWDRIPVTPDGKVADDFFDPPDIVVEIASPEQRMAALIQRCTWFVENGVRAAVLVQPGDSSVRLFRPDREIQVLRGTDFLDVSDILPGLHLTVDELFESLSVL